MGVEPVRLEAPESALLETLILEAPVAFALYDLDLRYRRINRTLAEINQLPMAAHIGRRPSEILDRDLGEAVEAMLMRVLSSGDVITGADFSREMPPGSGNLRHWQSSWYPARGPRGEILGVAVLVTDVTERRRTESALRASQTRSVRLQEATADLASALTAAEVVRVVSDVGARTVGADWAAVALVEGDLLHFSGGHGPVAGYGDAPLTFELGAPTLSALAVRRGTPIFVSSRAELPAVDPGGPLPLTAPAEQSWAVLPLVTADRPIGVLRLAFHEERRLDGDERTFLEALAGQCALAVERAVLYERQQRVAEVLQQELLPHRLPELAGFRLAARYLPSAEAEVGGDWYDAFELPDGRVAIVLGDVMGRGVIAAAGMGRLRASLRALALTDPAPQSVLAGLDRVFSALEADDQIATIVYALVDPGTGVVELADAGHLPLLLVPFAGEAEFVDAGPGSTPLGLPEPRTQRTLTLSPGDRLLLFSDGLVEDRASDIDEGLDRLRAAVRGAGATDLTALLDEVVGSALGSRRRDDDVTVLALCRASAPGGDAAGDLCGAGPGDDSPISVRRPVR